MFERFADPDNIQVPPTPTAIKDRTAQACAALGLKHLDYSQVQFEPVLQHGFSPSSIPEGTDVTLYFNVSGFPVTIKDRNGIERHLEPISAAESTTSDFRHTMTKNDHLYVIKISRSQLGLYRRSTIQGMEDRFSRRENLKLAYYHLWTMSTRMSFVSSELSAKLRTMHKLIGSTQWSDDSLDTFVIAAAIPLQELEFGKTAYVDSLDLVLRKVRYNYDRNMSTLDTPTEDMIHPFSLDGEYLRDNAIVRSIYPGTSGISIRIRSRKSMNNENKGYWNTPSGILEIPVRPPSETEVEGIYITQQDGNSGQVLLPERPVPLEQAQEHGIFFNLDDLDWEKDRVRAERTASETAARIAKQREEEKAKKDEDSERAKREAQRLEKIKLIATIVGAAGAVLSALFGIFRLLSAAVAKGVYLISPIKI